MSYLISLSLPIVKIHHVKDYEGEHDKGKESSSVREGSREKLE
jgi:hypothetical protein